MSIQAGRLLKIAVTGGIAAIVGAWFRGRHDEVVDEPAPGSAVWPPLLPVVEPLDGAPVEAGSGAWVAPDADGGCPTSHPIKAKESSGIYHPTDGLAYERTQADRCYLDAAAAEADGYRASKI